MAKLFFSPGFKLTPEDRRRGVRILAGLAFLIVLLAGAWMGHLVSRADRSQDPQDLAMGLQLMATIIQAVVATIKGPVVVLLACLQFAVLDRMELGRRLWHWAMGDAPKGKTDEELVDELWPAMTGIHAANLRHIITRVREESEPAHEDPEMVPAAKTLSAGLVFAALLVVNALLMGAGR